MFDILLKFLLFKSYNFREFFVSLCFLFNKIFIKDFNSFLKIKNTRNETEILKTAYLIKKNGVNDLTFLRLLSVTLNDYTDRKLAHYFSVMYFERKLCKIDDFLTILHDDIVSNGFLKKGDFNLSYSPVVGNENLGSIICYFGNKKLFGKVSFDFQNSREVYFFENVINSEFKQVAKFYFSSNVKINRYNINVLFFEELPSNGFFVKDNVEKVLDLYNSINNDLEQSLYLIKNKNYHVFFKKPFSYSIRYFIFNFFIVGFLKNIIKYDDYCYLNSVFIKNKIYKSVSLDMFEFVHNDFHWKNLNVTSERAFVFDMNSYCLGLKVWDLATYFSTCHYSFEKILDYLKNNTDLITNRNEKNNLYVNYFILFYLLLIKLRFKKPSKYYEKRNIDPSVSFLRSYNSNEKI